MKPLFLILASLVLCSCATRTGYGPFERKGGYSDFTTEGELYVARFSANKKTKFKTAMTFSNFRAIEVCREKGFALTKILETRDNSTSEKIQKASNFTHYSPTSFNGSSYNGNVSGSIGGGNSFGTSTAWTETLRFPAYDTYFTCHNEVNVAEVGLQNISSEQVKEFVKDNLGALQVMSLGYNSPNEKILEVGDVILRINGNRIISVPGMSKAIDAAKEKKAIPALIVRDGRTKSLNISSKNMSESISEQNAQIIKSACDISEVKKRKICVEISSTEVK